jgi:hypothetical protein
MPGVAGGSVDAPTTTASGRDDGALGMAGGCVDAPTAAASGRDDSAVGLTGRCVDAPTTTASGRGDGTLGAGLATPTTSPARRTPQAPQNFASSRFGASQRGQRRCEMPHKSQKRLPGGFSCPHGKRALLDPMPPRSSIAMSIRVAQVHDPEHVDPA